VFFADTGFPSAMLVLHSSHKCNSSAVTDPSDQLGEEEFMSNIKLRSISEYVYHVYAAALRSPKRFPIARFATLVLPLPKVPTPRPFP
jgi:hypothetical protein